MAKRVGLYLRVSTKNGQTVDNQRQALTDAIGRRPGWIIAEEFTDEGISGAKGRDRRPEFDRLLKEVVRGKVDVRWPPGRSIGLGVHCRTSSPFSVNSTPLVAISISKSRRSILRRRQAARCFRCLASSRSSSGQSIKSEYMLGLPECARKAPRAESR
jgi:hypothetical protein